MLQAESVFSLIENDLNSKYYSSAMRRLTTISNEYSRDLTFLNLLARTQRALADFAGLIRTLKQISKQTEADADQIELMKVLYSQGRLNEALDVALTLQEKELSLPQKCALSHCLVKIYLEFCDYEGVEEVYATYANSERDDVMLWAKGLVHLADEEKNEALEYFRKAVSINSANDQAWVSLSLLHEEMGDRELALANLDKAFDVNPHNATGLKLLTKWHQREEKQTQRVVEKVRHYLAHYEFDEEISLCYMQLLREQNDLSSLGFEAEKLILNNPSNPEFINIKKKLEAGMKTP